MSAVRGSSAAEVTCSVLQAFESRLNYKFPGQSAWTCSWTKSHGYYGKSNVGEAASDELPIEKGREEGTGNALQREYFYMLQYC